MKIGNRIISRITTLALAAGIAAALLCSCGGSGDGDETTAPDSETTPEVTTEQTTAKPETTEPETTEVTEPEPEPEPEHPTDDTTDEILRGLLSRSVPQASTEANYSEDGDLPIGLMYHLIMETPFNDYSSLFVRPEEFDDQLTAITNAGYAFLFADEYGPKDRPAVLVTFDDGYEDNYTTMFPILKAHGAKATIFMISNMIGQPGYLTEEQIKEMSDSGLVRFGSHTANHCVLANEEEDRVRDELSESARRIEEITGVPCRSMTYPTGKWNTMVTRIAEEYYDAAYLARPAEPLGGRTNMTIPRLYAARGLSGASLVASINNKLSSQ